MFSPPTKTLTANPKEAEFIDNKLFDMSRQAS